MRRLITLESAQWWHVAAGLLVVLIVIGLGAMPTWYRVYVVEQRGPALQRCFGFVAAAIDLPGDWSGTPRVFTITSVNPDGILASAGIRPGDAPVGYKHGMDVEFYGDLTAVLDGEDVTFSVVQMADWHKGSESWRVIRLRGQRGAC